MRLLRDLYEYHLSARSAYRNKLIIQVHFAHMPQALVCSDHRSNSKIGGACIYYKSVLPLRILSVQYLQESICLEFKLVKKLVTFYLSSDRRAKVKMTLKLY